MFYQVELVTRRRISVKVLELITREFQTSLRNSTFYCSTYGDYDGHMRADIVKWTIANGNRSAANRYDIS